MSIILSQNASHPIKCDRRSRWSLQWMTVAVDNCRNGWPLQWMTVAVENISFYWEHHLIPFHGEHLLSFYPMDNIISSLREHHIIPLKTSLRTSSHPIPWKTLSHPIPLRTSFHPIPWRTSSHPIPLRISPYPIETSSHLIENIILSHQAHSILSSASHPTGAGGNTARSNLGRGCKSFYSWNRLVALLQ